MPQTETPKAITAVSAFWIVESIPLTQSVFEMNEFAKFPLSIYPRAIGILLTWLIPYGFASFYPASHLLGHDVGALAWLGLPVAAALLFLGFLSARPERPCAPCLPR